MKRFIALAFLFSGIISSFSQDFAPLGAKWYYTERFFDSNNVGYLKLESVKDTVIHDKSCHAIINNFICGALDFDTVFVYQADSMVLFLNPMMNAFQILYNYKAKKGDSWLTIFRAMNLADTTKVVVDSVSTVTINDHKLIWQRVSYYRTNVDYENYPVYTGVVIEHIGDLQFLFNLYSTKYACDGNISGGLRCYSDPNFGFYSTGIASSCNYTFNSIGEMENKSQFELFPNPSKSKVQIKTNTVNPLNFEIIDFTGKVLKSGVYHPADEINLTHFQPGIYIVSLREKNKVLGYRKLIKF